MVDRSSKETSDDLIPHKMSPNKIMRHFFGAVRENMHMHMHMHMHMCSASVVHV